MCLLVVRKKGSWLPSDSEISNAWGANPDGFGFAYVQSGQIWVAKTMLLKECKALIREIPANVPLLLHWRWGTHGSKTEENCHPFPFLNGNWVGAHNGVLSAQLCLPNKTDTESYLASLTKRPTISQVEADIARLQGGSSKIACMSNKGEIILANERHGEYREEHVWESNSGLDGWGSGSPLLPKGYYSSSRSRLVRAICWYCDAPAEWVDEADSMLLCDRCADEQEGVTL